MTRSRLSSNKALSAVGVIPARWGSTRFPGKSLALIAGRPLIEWVVIQARKARRLSAVWVATDDERIRAAVERIDCEVVMTRPDHPSGTDRIAEAIYGRSADIVINIQGDEPMIDPGLIDDLAACLQDEPEWDMATAAAPIEQPADVQAPTVVKVVTNAHDQALYFSRAPIPFVRDAGTAPAGLFWRHIGIYAYRRAFLELLVSHAPCETEQAEKLEQLRALHLGARIKVLRVRHVVGCGVDVPEDVARVEEAMKRADVGA